MASTPAIWRPCWARTPLADTVALLQPVLILLVGVLVRYTVLAIMLPVMNISQFLG